MTYRITIQNASLNKTIPQAKLLKAWATAALHIETPAADMTLRIVDKAESQQLNHTYRHKDKPTNILSFPAHHFPGKPLKVPPLGDIIICADLVQEEASTQEKDVKAHWAHLIIHGTLHLLGYDHESIQDAKTMEAKEIAILEQLGFSNPYLTDEKVKDNE